MTVDVVAQSSLPYCVHTQDWDEVKQAIELMVDPKTRTYLRTCSRRLP